MSGRILGFICLLSLTSCVDNREQPIVVNTLTDAGTDTLSSNSSIDASAIDEGPEYDETCYFEEALTSNNTCDPGFVEINLPRGDRCAAPCSHQVECPRGCICFSDACITANDLL